MATDQSTAKQDESQQKASLEIEIQITMIAGKLYQWTFAYPGKWELYTPKPGDLLRVWHDPQKDK